MQPLGEQGTIDRLLQNVMTLFSAQHIRVVARNLVLPISFILPIAILYIREPQSFEEIWQGRAPYFIFLWLFFLEFVLGAGKLPKNVLGAKWARTIIALVLLAIPIGYAIDVSYFGFQSYVNFLADFGKLAGVPYKDFPQLPLLRNWALSVEYLFFTVIFIVSIMLVYGIKGLKRFPISLFMIALIGSVYMIDTFYPYGTLAMFQNLVQPTAASTTFFLNLMGYKASWYNTVGYAYPNSLDTILMVSGGRYYVPPILLYWPCAGIQSLAIYTVAILLFIRGAGFSLKKKIVYFAVGAVGTFFVNVLRIVSIVVIGLNSGPKALDEFHRYYGELYFIAWIILYPLAIIYGRNALTKLFKLILRATTRLYKEILTLIQRIKNFK